MDGRVTLKGILRKSITSITYPVAGKGKVIPTYAMKAYRGSGGIAPLILNLGTRWMCGQPHALVVYQCPPTPPQLHVLEKKEISCACWYMKTALSNSSLVTILSMLYELPNLPSTLRKDIAIPVIQLYSENRLWSSIHRDVAQRQR